MPDVNAQDAVGQRNPFADAMASELIDSPEQYVALFSPTVLMGQARRLFEAKNTVLVGPLSSGKTMLLNLLRYVVMHDWLKTAGAPPAELGDVPPFLGISVNLTRASFHTFGQRAPSLEDGAIPPDQSQSICASDFLTHYLLREYLKALTLILSDDGLALRKWLGLPAGVRSDQDIAQEIAEWPCWFGYYRGASDLKALLRRVEERLSSWHGWLNFNVDSIPDDVWRTKTTPREPLHSMGNLLRSLEPESGSLPLFVSIDQYEEIRYLGGGLGTDLQRVVNGLFKARDPAVFYKLGVRTHDWGRELRVLGSEATIEAQRDYVLVDLARILMRSENSEGLFRKFALDVAHKRLKVFGRLADDAPPGIPDMLGSKLDPSVEARHYLADKSNPRLRGLVWGDLPQAVREALGEEVDPEEQPLDALLAGVWARQSIRREDATMMTVAAAREKPWTRSWWRKERVLLGLYRLASLTNQRKLYAGWHAVLYLSGANIYAFLLICGHIWDVAQKQGISPLTQFPLPPVVQSYGIYNASRDWRERNVREHNRGDLRDSFVRRLAAAVKEAVVNDTMSNPGHSGFSLREFGTSPVDVAVKEFLEEGVGWGFFEERIHKPKQKNEDERRKFYLHPLLSPVFAVPFIRVKEPFYASMDSVWQWIFSDSKIVLRRSKTSGCEAGQLHLGDI